MKRATTDQIVSEQDRIVIAEILSLCNSRFLCRVKCGSSRSCDRATTVLCVCADFVRTYQITWPWYLDNPCLCELLWIWAPTNFVKCKCEWVCACVLGFSRCRCIVFLISHALVNHLSIPRFYNKFSLFHLNYKENIETSNVTFNQKNIFGTEKLHNPGPFVYWFPCGCQHSSFNKVHFLKWESKEER